MTDLAAQAHTHKAVQEAKRKASKLGIAVGAGIWAIVMVMLTYLY